MTLAHDHFVHRHVVWSGNVNKPDPKHKNVVWSGNVSKPDRSQLVPPVERGEMNVKHIFLYIPIPHGLRESARVWALEASVRGSYARFIDFSTQNVVWSGNVNKPDPNTKMWFGRET